MIPKPIEQTVIEKLKCNLKRLSCPRHPLRSLQKICKHYECRGRQQLCSICLSDHDMAHFSFLEDIEAILQSSSVKKLSDLSIEITKRIAKQSVDRDRDRLMSMVVHQFDKLFEENKDRLIECLVKTAASLKNREIEERLRDNTANVTRRYNLLMETRGDDPEFLKEFLTAYTESMALHSEIGASFQTAGSTYNTHPQVKKFLEGIHQLSNSINLIISERLKELFEKFGGKLLGDPEEVESFVLNNTAQIPIVINEEQNGFIPKKKIRKDRMRERRPREFNLEAERFEPRITKKIKYSSKPIIIADAPNPSRKREGSPQIEMNKRPVSSKVNSTKFGKKNLLSVTRPNYRKDKGMTSSGVVSRQKKIRKDFRSCLYADPVKNLVLLLFSVPMNRKYLSKFINFFDAHSLQTILCENLAEAVEILEQIQSNFHNSDQLPKLSSKFYTLLPLREQYVIDSTSKIKKLLPIIEMLSSFRMTYEILKGPRSEGNQIIDTYRQLKCLIDPADKSSTEYAVIQEYFLRTCQPTDEISIKNIYELDRIGEREEISKFEGNRTLLWYGCRFSGVVKILKCGFKYFEDIPESLYNGNRVINLFDRVTDCLGYCQADNENPSLMFFLCEVSLGPMNSLTSRFKEGTYLCLDEGVMVPNEEPDFEGPRRRYVVEDPDQIRIRYLFECSLNTKEEERREISN